MVRLAQRSEPIRVVEDYVASPTYAPELADRVADMVEADLQGMFHVGGGTAISWFEFARLIFEAAGLQPELRPTTDREHRSAAARRPKFSALSNEKMHRAGIRPMPPLRQALQEYMHVREESLSSKRA